MEEGGGGVICVVSVWWVCAPVCLVGVCSGVSGGCVLTHGSSELLPYQMGPSHGMGEPQAPQQQSQPPRHTASISGGVSLVLCFRETIGNNNS